MARKRKGRPVNGVVLIDKSSGMTSNQVLQKVRWLYNAEKAGHTGTLDPAATGLLPICLGEATKFSQFLLDATKTYLAIGRLGITTDTLDAEGAIIDQRPVPDNWAVESMEKVLADFRGDILQVPPMYSALKRDGKKLVDLARQGIAIELEPRPVTILDNRLIAMNLPEFELSVTCSKGTYIRTLVADIGEVVGCGAHVKALHRTQHGAFTIDGAVTIDTLQSMRESGTFEQMDALLIGIDELLSTLPDVNISVDRAHYFCHGNDIQSQVADGRYRVYSDGRFLGVADQKAGRLQPVRLVRQS